MEKFYKTINKKANAEIIEKKSRFIANILPVSSEDEAINFISSIKKEHYNARHNCYAYVIKGDIPIIRFSDDGEPSGTAGKPILDVLQGNDIQNAVIVVTRYFGGTLLGTGGLVRAYGKSAKEALINAQIVTMNSYQKIFIEVDYSLIGKIQYKISSENIILINTEYTDIVTFSVYVCIDDVKSFIDDIINLTNDSGKITKENIYFLKTINNNIID